MRRIEWFGDEAASRLNQVINASIIKRILVRLALVGAKKALDIRDVVGDWSWGKVI